MNINYPFFRGVKMLQEKKSMGISVMRNRYKRAFYEPWENIVRKIGTAQKNKEVQYLYHPKSMTVVEEALKGQNGLVLLHGLFQEESFLQEWLAHIMVIPQLRPRKKELDLIASKNGYCSELLINGGKSIRQGSDLILLRPKSSIDEWKNSDTKKKIWKDINKIYKGKSISGTLEAGILQYLWFGKRVRPWIFYELTKDTELPGDTREKIMVMIEFIQSATLVVDDIVDGHTYRDSELRPTLSSKFGVGEATMISHDLMRFAEDLILGIEGEIGISLVNKIIEIKNRMTSELFNGQWIDMWCLKKNSGEKWVNWCFEEAYKKTYALIQFPFNLAKLFSDNNESKNYPEIGKKLGIIYQLMDDLQELDKNDASSSSFDFSVAYLLDKENLPKEEKELLLTAIGKKQKHKIAKDADRIIKNLCRKYNQEIKESGLEYASNIYKEMVLLYPEGFTLADDIEGIFLMLVGSGYWAYQEV